MPFLSLFSLVIIGNLVRLSSRTLLYSIMALVPEDVNDAVVLLAADFFPFGRDCAITSPVQSVLHHYDVTPASVQVLEEEEFFKLRDVRMADPDGDDAARALFESTVMKRIPGRLQQMKIRLAFRRMMRPDPYGAVVVAPASDVADRRPAKRRRADPSSDASDSAAAGVKAAGAAVTPSSSSAPLAPAASSQASASSAHVVSDLFGSSDEEDADILGVVVDGDGGVVAESGAAVADDAGEDKTKLTVQKNVVTLFNDLANEVFAL